MGTFFVVKGLEGKSNLEILDGFMIVMASKSRAAQEQLQTLEKEAAPFEEQLVEAAKFIGTTLGGLRRFEEDGFERKGELGGVVYHGREEWLLRWLLKRLQAPKDEIPRQTPSSWLLFAYLVKTIPLFNVAQILVERKFISIVRLAIEEVEKRDVDPVPEAADSESSSTERGSPEKKSKKRKRSGEVVPAAKVTKRVELSDLVGAIFTAVNCIVECTNVTSGTVELGRSSAFLAEYMKTVIRAPAEEAATILGLWLSLCRKALSSTAIANNKIRNWISPFIAIWQCHTADESQYLQFSLHSTKPLLSLLQILRTGQYLTLNWTSQLEALAARNIIVPAKAAYSEDKASEVLNSLTRISILQDSANSAILFEIAIRCIQVPGARKRRKPQDDAWLAAVFNTLKSAIPSRASSATAIAAMLQFAIDYKVSIDLATLREITWEYGLTKESDDWNLVATVLKLDGNTFLIPDEKDLLKELFERITKASSQLTWSENSGVVVSKVVVPLMNEFARARDLSGFIKHWYTQFVEFQKLENPSSPYFSAWEDEVLQTELARLFEPSLTVHQISQILDWLETEVKEALANHDSNTPDGVLDPVCIILEAIAGSISGDESVVDAVRLRLYHIIFDNNASELLSSGNKWRSWRILLRTLAWIEHSDIDNLSMLWENGKRPFKSLKQASSKGYHTMVKDGKNAYNNIEILSFACTAWEATEAEKSGRLKMLAKPLLVTLLQHTADSFKTYLSALLDGNVDVIDAIYQPIRCTDDPSIGWAMRSFARCLFVEHPECLELGLEIEGDGFKDLLQHLLWIASAGYGPNDASSYVSQSNSSYPELWTSVLSRDSPIFKQKRLARIIVDTLLKSTSNSDNPLINTNTNNSFATHCLHILRLDDISKSQKEQIMMSWSTPESTVLDLPVIALKVKIMRHPAIYEGMKFKDLIQLAVTLAEADVAAPQNHLALLKELTRLIFGAALGNIDQKRNATYITDSFKTIQKKINKASKKKPLNFALTGIIEVTLAAFHEKEMALNDQDIILRDDLESITATFKEALFTQIKQLLDTDTHDVSVQVALISVIDALSALGVDSSQLAQAHKMPEEIDDISNNELNTRSKLEAFMAIHSSKRLQSKDLRGDAITIIGRDSIIQRTQAAMKDRNTRQKLELLQDIICDSSTGLVYLDELLAARQVIASIEETKGRKDEEPGFTLSAAYTYLAEHLPKVTEIRQFCLITETLELMLKTKGHSMSQYNIDSTIGSITVFCSSQAPALPSIHAGTIYTHLCRLLQTILMHHRLKLQGHTHLAQQAMQALLRCLFAPTNAAGASSIINAKAKFASPPSWLQSLSLPHAQHFTKLLLLIADPPLSTLSQGRTNPLVSLKDKAKRMSAQWTKYILQEYIWLQLDMNVRMEGEVREAMMQGWFAVLETMNESGRDAMRGEMDNGGRAVFRGLFEEWRRVGGRRE